ncbi:MAG TPA: DUF6624 domain-containing protein [Euzebyales bacterium]|nr:DUF6624 domain-containing protein [Euzebyales bacterium]
MRVRQALAVLLLAPALGCSGAGDEGGAGAGAAEGRSAAPSSLATQVGDPTLRAELLGMLAADQHERVSEPVESWDDEARTRRLAEIIDERGWPTRDLVGADAATAAWAIAQHSDLDVEFQERALGLMREAVAAQQADASELAYLEDRVASNRGRPQIYGTQIGCVDGHAEPAELAEPDRVDELRAEVGLGPLADYLDELEPACAAEATG